MNETEGESHRLEDGKEGKPHRLEDEPAGQGYLCLRQSSLLKMRRPKVDFPGLWYNSVNFWRANDQSNRLRQSWKAHLLADEIGETAPFGR